MTVLVPGLSAARSHGVTAADTALALGSGDLPVLATPRLLAWCEGACVAVITDATAGPATGTEPATTTNSSVGTRVLLEHSRATPVGATVDVRAELAGVDGRLLRFRVAALDGAGRTVATGELTRVLVERERFLARV